jgi:hypothetical protein
MGSKMNKAEVSENEDEDVIIEEEVETSEAPSDELDDETEDTESDDVIVSIGEEAPPPEEQTQAPEWVRELRKTNRELQRQNRELQGKLQTTQTETKPVVLGKKPSLEDHDYDSEKYEDALTNWFDS